MYKKKILIIIGFIISVCIIGISVYKIIETSNKVNQDSNGEVLNKNTKIKEDLKIEDEKEETETKKNEVIIDDDLESLKKEILNDNNSVINLETCSDNGLKDENGLPKFEKSTINLSNKSLDVILNKLRQSTNVEVLPTGKTCPSYIFEVTTNIDGNESKIMSVMYSDDEKSLLVGIKGTGYVYHYENESDLSNLLETLK